MKKSAPYRASGLVAPPNAPQGLKGATAASQCGDQMLE